MSEIYTHTHLVSEKHNFFKGFCLIGLFLFLLTCIHPAFATSESEKTIRYFFGCALSHNDCLKGEYADREHCACATCPSGCEENEEQLAGCECVCPNEICGDKCCVFGDFCLNNGSMCSSDCPSRSFCSETATCCGGNTPFCYDDGTKEFCVECEENDDCKTDEFCVRSNDPTFSGKEYTCQKCTTHLCNNQTQCCPADKPYCLNNYKCVECIQNTDCPENQYCVQPNDPNNFGKEYTCQPCSKDGSVKRGKNDSQCACPAGEHIYCGSTKSSGSTKCQVGGTWVCESGCRQNVDCPAGYQCSCNGNGCPKGGGQCIKCPTGTYRSSTGSNCVQCLGCEQLNADGTACVNACASDEMCLATKCSNNKTDGLCSPTHSAYSCVKRPDLIQFKGKLNGRLFYLPPAQTAYRMYHDDAVRFCESYGLHLASLQEACAKDYAYDSGHDCPNITSNSTFADLADFAGKKYSLSKWHVNGDGSFWINALDSTQCQSLRVTYSCGNNHEAGVCGQYYPLCTD